MPRRDIERRGVRMEDFNWWVPTRFVFGRQAEDGIGRWAAGEGYKHAMLVSGRGHAQKSGLVGRVRASLEEAGVDVVELSGVRPNPEIGLVRKGALLAREQGCDLVVAVGGGSVIDCAKGIAVGALDEPDVDLWNHYRRPNPLPVSRALSVACIPTIPAAGSEASGVSVVSNDALGFKSSCKGDLIRPRVAFMDPELTLSLPPEQTAAGICDMCCHIFERYFSETGEVPATDQISLAALRSIRAEALRLLDDPQCYEARANIMWLGTLAHDGLCALGRKEDWASHGMEHELSAASPQVTHGAGLAVLFPAWMRHVYRARPERFCELGREVFGLASTGDAEADALAAIREVSRFFSALGLPSTLDELGFSPADVDRFLTGLAINRGTEFGSFMRLGLDDAREIYLDAFAKQERG